MKIFYVIIVLLIINSTTDAQILRGYGFKVGATLATEDWDYKEFQFKPDSRWGLNIGVFTELLNIPYFSLVTELNYVQKGMKEDIPITTTSNPDGTGEYITWDTRVDYINIGALGKLRFELGLFTPYILVGPKVDFEINQENSLEYSDIVEQNFSSTIYGIKTGVGTEIKLNSFSILAEVIYDCNFNNLYENEHLTVTSNSVDFRLGMMF